MKDVFKQPLLHFILIGCFLFALFELTGARDDAAADSRTITVDHQALLDFIQQRSKAFNQSLFEQKLASMPAEEKQALIDELVREEALYREARSLGLDKGDYVIKRRVIQKLEFVTEGLSKSAVEINKEQLRDYFDKHRQEYFIAPTITFTHVFFNSELHGKTKAEELALEKLGELNAGRVPFNDGIRHGDRFLYHLNYADKTPDLVASHFGEAMAEKLFVLPPDQQRWYGPYKSAYGYHLVKLSDRNAGRSPALGEVRSRVVHDARQSLLQEHNERAYQAIIDTYRVKVDPDLQAEAVADPGEQVAAN
jgi:hypothetical protein